jgi:hypothetical protein
MTAKIDFPEDFFLSLFAAAKTENGNSKIIQKLLLLLFA